MSVVLGEIGRPGLAQGIGCFPVGGSPEISRRPPEVLCSSSIGRDSDCSGSEAGGNSPEVQSRLKSPLETMDVLEDSLPLRRGISNFCCGKSKSFTSLAEAVKTTSAKDLAKPENAYSRKRKNILASSSIWGDNLDDEQSANWARGMPKKPTNSSRSTTASQTPSTSSSGSNSSEEELKPQRLLPPGYPNSKLAASAADTSLLEKFSFPLRSLSMMDLPGVASSGPSFCSRIKYKQLF